MNWRAELSHEAERQLKRLPRDMQARIGRAIDELEADPFRLEILEPLFSSYVSLAISSGLFWLSPRVSQPHVFYNPTTRAP